MSIDIAPSPHAPSAPTPTNLLADGPITLTEWDTHWSQRDDAYELVDGIPTMAPNEIQMNTDAAMLLAERLRSRVHRRWVPSLQVGLTLRDGSRPTVRVADFALIARESDRRSARFPTTAIGLVAEAVSPTSIERDLVTKRHEYASAGIPGYLVIDLANPRAPLTLLTDPRDGDYRTVTSGTTITLHIDDDAIDIRANDLRV